MGPYLLVIFHGFAIYGGAQFTKLDHASVGKVIAVALLSYVGYIIAFFIGFFVVPVSSVPLFASLFLAVGTALLSKAMLSAEWKQAWIIGGVAGLVNVLGTVIFSGFAAVIS